MLAPAYVGSNGYRYYEREQLLRLQRVLLLRELGLGLDAIADVLTGDVDQVTAHRYDAVQPGLAEFLRDATAAYSSQHLD